MKKLAVLFAALRTADFSFENHPKGIQVSLLLAGQWFDGRATLVDQSGTPMKNSGAWTDFKESVAGEGLVVRLDGATTPDKRANNVMFIEADLISAVVVVDPKLVEASQAAADVVHAAGAAEAAA